MPIFRKTVSKSKRPIVYREPNPPAPYSDVYHSGDKIAPRIFHLRGSETNPHDYVTKDGVSLVDMARFNASNKDKVQTFATRKFRSKDTMAKFMSDMGLQVEFFPGGCVASAYGMIFKKDIEAWQKGEVYRYGIVDDPTSDDWRTLYVDDVSKIPGPLTEVSGDVEYDRFNAEFEATRIANRLAPVKSYRFKVILKDFEPIDYDKARRLGYDGREMALGEEFDAGKFILRRVPAPMDDVSAMNVYKRKRGEI